jgi:hypothetical protein
VLKKPAVSKQTCGAAMAKIATLHLLLAIFLGNSFTGNRLFNKNQIFNDNRD